MVRRTLPRTIALTICSRKCVGGRRNDLSVRFVRSRLLFALSSVLIMLFLSVASAQDRPKIEVVQNSPDGLISAVAFSPDGTLVLTGSGDKTLKLWDVATGKLLRSFDGHIGEVRSVAFSPDGTRALSGSKDKTLKLWDVATGKLLRTFEGHTFDVNSVAFSPDGARALSGSGDDTLKLWDVATGKVLRTFGNTDWLHSVNSVTFSPDGTLALSGSEDKTLKLWDVATGKLLRTFEGHAGWVRSVAFSPNGTCVLSGSWENTLETLKLWDIATGKVLRTLEGHLNNVASVAFSPDGTRALSGGEETLELWDVATGNLLRTWDVHNAGNVVESVAFSPDGTRALAGGGATLKLWDVASGRLLRDFEGDSLEVTSVALSPDGIHALSGGGDNTLRLWDVSTGKILRTLKGHTNNIDSVAFSPDGTRALSGSYDNKMRLWDLAHGQLLRTFEGHTGRVLSVAFSPDGSRALSGSADNTFKLWDLATGKLLRTFAGDYAVLSPDGTRALSGSTDHTFKLWDVATGKLLRTSEGYPESVESLAFSPDGTRALSGSRGDNTLKLWNLATGKLLRTFEGHADMVTSFAFSRDGTRALSGSWDKTLKLWDVATGKLLRTFVGHTGWVSSVAFSRDGTRALSGGSEGRIGVWDIASGRAIASLWSEPNGNWLAITPDGFFSASPRGDEMLAVVRGLEVTTIAQVHQSLFSPDLVRESLADDPDGEVRRAAEVINLAKVVDSGPAPLAEITSPASGGKSDTDLVSLTARIKDRGKGVGRIEWRVNGVTTAVMNAHSGAGPEYEVKQTLALDPGENAIQVVAYNARNLLASLPAQTTITYDAPADAVKPKLYVLAIGINAYHDDGWTPPGATKREYFPPLKLAVDDARSIGAAFKEAGSGFYGQVIVQTAFDEEATATALERIVQEISAEINPRDTFVLFAAAHGYSNNGRFYLLPQDYNGGTDPSALMSRAIGQDRLQDWIANRIKARRAIILLDTCESGALTNGYAHSRTDAPASEAAVGRLHEATGRPVLTAAAAGEPAFEGYQGHGVFTWALIDALFHGDTNGDGLIELSELATHVQNTVPKISAEMNGRGIAEVLTQLLLKEDRQTAHFGSTGGDFALVQRLQ
jgi:WD40 repeat protein